MKVYWIKAQAPRRVLALVKHLAIPAEFVEVAMMAGGFKTESAGACRRRSGVLGGLGDHGLSLYPVGVRYVAGAQRRRASRSAALVVVERLPLVARRGAVLF